jgi:hypothetical protein
MVVCLGRVAAVNRVISQSVRARIIEPVLGLFADGHLDKCGKAFVTVTVTEIFTLSVYSRYIAPGPTDLKIVSRSRPRSYLPSEPRIFLFPLSDPQSIFYLIFRKFASGIVFPDSMACGRILAIGPAVSSDCNSTPFLFPSLLRFGVRISPETRLFLISPWDICHSFSL